ncbi:MAG TPA: aminopeptidase P family protein [Silvibacterium sp.]|nr:aminopeptidase P family protein [Silvibacterium sp.]
MSDGTRLRALRASMAGNGVESLLVTHLPDVRWLCCFTGSNAALAITGNKAVLFTDGRYTVQAKQETRVARVVIAKKSALKEACTLLESLTTRASYDPEHTTIAELSMMCSAISPKARRSLFAALQKPLIAELRMVKDSQELRLMENAAALGDRVFNAVLPHIESGVAETEIAASLEFFARSMGAEGMSFETIVASGQRSALPHGKASSAKTPRNGFITLDFGVILKGYCSDMTRTVCVGKVSRDERAAYETVVEAQRAGVAAVKPGATCGEVDEAARAVLRKAGLAKYFAHSTGHGVGLEIHEAPRLAAGQTLVLKPGMVVTVEPGVYLAGKFGIRIEDMVAVTQRGNRVLTNATKTLIEL